MTVSGHFSCPPPGSFVAVSGQFLVAADMLGLDVRDYEEDGTFVEIAWSAYEGRSAVEAGAAALVALDRGSLPGEWVLITW